MRLPLLLLLALFSASSGLAAALTWAEREQTASVLTDEPVVRVSFAFRNDGAKPVRLTQLGASCKCTELRAEPQEVAPGGEGVVSASIRIDGLPGVFKRSLYVQTDGQEEMTTLDVHLTVTPVVGFQPRLVWWKEGQEGQVKEVEVKVAEPAVTRLGALRSEVPGFHADWVPGQEGKRLRLRVDPSVKDVQAKIFLDYERNGRTDTVFLFATVP